MRCFWRHHTSTTSASASGRHVAYSGYDHYEAVHSGIRVYVDYYNDNSQRNIMCCSRAVESYFYPEYPGRSSIHPEHRQASDQALHHIYIQKPK